MATGRTVRNVAIIAHVDHGKTTLVDCLLRQSGTIKSLQEERVMDSNTLEKERGITILAKCTSIASEKYTINIVDTPGHADFGGEVERALTMVDGVILVVDATEGPMPQTKFVLSKALKRDLLPIVVQNKVDRSTARCEEVDCELLDLFLSLQANEKQLDYPTFYASAKDGWAFPFNPHGRRNLIEKGLTGDMSCLLDAIVEKMPPPAVQQQGPFSLLVNSIENNSFVGRCMLGRIQSGSIRLGDRIKAMAPSGEVVEENRVTRMFVRRGLLQVDIQEAEAGDIVSIAGIQQGRVNHTLASPEVATPLDTIPIDPPTVSMTFLVNNSPMAGIEGKPFTRITLLERLQQECENNVALNIEPIVGEVDAFKVSGRGEMQLGILIETIRREGFELAVSPPQVLLRESRPGLVMEPIEEVIVDCDEVYGGSVIEKITKRKGELTRMLGTGDGKCRMVFTCPTRGLIGYGSELKNDTKGTGILNHSFVGYEPHKGIIESSRKGSLISMADGVATGYALADLEPRGRLFLGPGTRVYAGMVIGECARAQDLEVNPCRAKILTNVRSSVKEEFFRLTPPKLMSLEEIISYMAEDEILEVTPKAFRLRKYHLDSNKRPRKTIKKSS